MKDPKVAPLLRIAELLRVTPSRDSSNQSQPVRASTERVETDHEVKAGQAEDLREKQMIGMKQPVVAFSNPSEIEDSEPSTTASKKEEDDERQTPIVWFRSKL